MRPWAVAVVVALVVAALVLLFSRSDDPSLSEDGADGRGGAGAPTAPRVLEGRSPGGERGRETEPRPYEPAATPEEPVVTAAEGPRITGRVVDDETERGLPGIGVWAEGVREPCPRLPSDFLGVRRSSETGVEDLAWDGGTPVATTDAKGAFELRLAVGATAPADVFAVSREHVMGCACRVEPGATVTLRLKRGLEIAVDVVSSHDGSAVESAHVVARPAPGTPLVPGTVAQAIGGKDGRFAVKGLVPARVAVTVDHWKFMPRTLEPMEPPESEVRVTLVPALLARFVLKTGDGGEAKNPTLAWTATGRGAPPVEEMLLLQLKVDEPVPVKIPCDRSEVVFTLKAEGYAPWVSSPEPLPPEGGERTFEVTLERDVTLGALKVALEDRDGNALSWVGEQAEARFSRRDPMDIPAGIVMQPGEALRVPALPAGPYVVFVRSPKHAPAAVQVAVVAGVETEAKATLGPPAKLRVRFTSTEPTIVRFRVLAGRDLAYPFPEGAASIAQTEEQGAPVLHAGAEGLVLSGLASGRHVVEVVSENLSAPATPVDLVEGETREVEIAVTPR